MKNKLVVLMSILAILLIVNQAEAGTNLHTYSHGIVEMLRGSIAKVAENVVKSAYKLLYVFATINVVIVGMKQLFNGANFQAFILEMVKFLMLIAFFTFILTQGPTAFINASQEFIGVATGTPYKIESFVYSMFVKMDVFFGVVVAIVKDVNLVTMNTRLLIAAFCAFATGMVVLAIAINLLMTLVRSWFVLSAGIFAVGLGGLSFTNQYAINYLKAFLSYGIQFMALAFIGSVVMQYCDDLAKSIGWNGAQFTDTSAIKAMDFIDSASMLCSMLILFFMAFSVPQAVLAVFEGGSQATKTWSAAAITAGVAKTAMAIKTAGASQAIGKGAGAISNFAKGQQTDINVGSGGGNSGGSGGSNPLRDRSREQ